MSGPRNSQRLKDKQKSIAPDDPQQEPTGAQSTLPLKTGGTNSSATPSGERIEHKLPEQTSDKWAMHPDIRTLLTSILRPDPNGVPDSLLNVPKSLAEHKKALNILDKARILYDIQIHAHGMFEQEIIDSVLRLSFKKKEPAKATTGNAGAVMFTVDIVNGKNISAAFSVLTCFENACWWAKVFRRPLTLLGTPLRLPADEHASALRELRRGCSMYAEQICEWEELLPKRKRKAMDADDQEDDQTGQYTATG